MQSQQQTNKRIKLNQETHPAMNKIKCTVKAETKKQIEDEIRENEKYKYDSSRHHQAMKKIKSKKPKKPLIMKEKQ